MQQVRSTGARLMMPGAHSITPIPVFDSSHPSNSFNGQGHGLLAIVWLAPLPARRLPYVDAITCRKVHCTLTSVAPLLLLRADAHSTQVQSTLLEAVGAHAATREAQGCPCTAGQLCRSPPVIHAAVSACPHHQVCTGIPKRSQGSSFCTLHSRSHCHSGESCVQVAACMRRPASCQQSLVDWS